MPAPRAFLAIVVSCALARAAEPLAVAQPLRWRFGGESMRVEPGERMGLAHVVVDVVEPWPALPGAYAGIGGYAAVRGERGGFLVVGGELGWRRQLVPALALDLGAFAGGGGGGAAPQGGGLMLRPHAALAWTVAHGVALRTEIAYVRFPNGAIASTDAAVGIEFADAITGIAAAPQGADAAAPTIVATARRTRLTTAASWWRPCGCGTKRDGGELPRSIELVGARIDRFVDEHWFVAFAVDGALGGGVAGYMDALGGVGASYPLLGPVAGEVALLAGAGGGGGVDTGGGFVLEPRVALTARAGRVGGEVALGQVVAPGGEFHATAASLGVAWQADALTLPAGVARARVPGAEADPWRLTAIAKTYLPDASARRKDGGDMPRDLDLVGVGLEKPLTTWLALTGRGFGAWRGGSGGYAEGLIGVGARAPLAPWPRLVLTLDVAGGAGGGGSVDSGSGLIGAATAGARVALTDACAVGVEAGRVDAAHGSFAATSLALTLTWTFARAVVAEN